MYRYGKGKILFTLVIVMGIVFFGVNQFHGIGYAQGPESFDIGNMLKQTSEYYRENKTDLTSWDELVALAISGEDIHKSPWRLPEWKSEDLDEETPIATYAGYVLGLMARGQDPKDIWDRNLLEELGDMQEEDGAFDTINGHIWTVIALDAANGHYDKGKAMEYLISQQKDDGGYAFGDDNTPEVPSEPDMTGMALVALSNHRDIEGVEEMIEGVLGYLKAGQLSTGGFESWGMENANSIAAVISGLVAIDEDILSEQWRKDGNTMLEALQGFMLDDGSFTYSLDPKESNYMATSQALIALNDIEKKSSTWHDLGDSARETSVRGARGNREGGLGFSSIYIYIILGILGVGGIIYLVLKKRQVEHEQ